MPTIFNHNEFRFFFYRNDHLPRHIHVEKSGKTAKFNINPIKLVVSIKFSATELREIRMMIQENIEFIEKNWDEYFN